MLIENYYKVDSSQQRQREAECGTRGTREAKNKEKERETNADTRGTRTAAQERVEGQHWLGIP